MIQISLKPSTMYSASSEVSSVNLPYSQNHPFRLRVVIIQQQISHYLQTTTGKCSGSNAE